MLGIVIGPLQPVDVGRDMHVGRIVEIAENAIRPDLVEELPLRRPFAGDVELECGREGPVGLDLAHHLGRQLLLAHEVEIEMLGIGVGGDHRRAINRPVGGDDTAGAAVRRLDLGDGAVGEDVDAMAAAIGGKRLGDGAHAALDEAPAARPLMLAHQVMHDHIGRARRLRSGKGADRSVIGEHRHDSVVLEPFLQEVVGRHGEQIDDAIKISADPAIPPQKARSIAECAPVALGGIERRLPQQLPHDARRLAQISVEGGIDLGIAPREFCEAGLGLGHVVREHDIIRIRHRRHHVGAGQDLDPQRLEIEVADDPRVQQAHQIGKDGGAKAWRDLLCHRRAADDRAPLEHRHLATGARQIVGAHQPVVARADDHRVVAVAHASPPAGETSAEAGPVSRSGAPICSSGIEASNSNPPLLNDNRGDDERLVPIMSSRDRPNPL